MMVGWLRRRLARHRTGQLPWRQVGFLVVDFETTSLDLRVAEPLSVGWVPVEGGRVRLAEAGYSLVRHDGEVPTESLQVHRILPADVATAPPPEQVGRALGRALAGRMLVAHAAGIELAMLRRCGLRVPAGEVVDTLRLSQRLDRLEHAPGRRPRTLPALAERLGLPVHRPHHAFGDALTTAELFLALACGLERHGAGRLADLRRSFRPGAWP